MKRLIVITLLVIGYLLLVKTSFAQYGGYGGGPPPATIMIEKMVGKPGTVTKGGTTTYEYVYNLSVNDLRFHANEEVNFRIRVKNTSSVTLNNVIIKDTMPSYIIPIEGPGTYDANSRIITFNIGSLAPDEEKIYFLKAKVVDQNQLPVDKGLFCLVNKAEVNSEINNTDPYDQATSQFCIEKQVASLPKVPASGPEMGVLLLGGEILSLGFGILITRKYRSYKIPKKDNVH